MEKKNTSSFRKDGRHEKVITIEPAKQVTHKVELPRFTKRRVAGYARVSTDHEDQTTSYEAQMTYYTDYINSRSDWEFVKMYSDEGISGTNTKRDLAFKKWWKMPLTER